MKFSELLDEYLTLREEMNTGEYYHRNSIPNRQYDQQHCLYLLQQLDEIVEGVNRAEET